MLFEERGKKKGEPTIAFTIPKYENRQKEKERYNS